MSQTIPNLADMVTLGGISLTKSTPAKHSVILLTILKTDRVLNNETSLLFTTSRLIKFSQQK